MCLHLYDAFHLYFYPLLLSFSRSPTADTPTSASRKKRKRRSNSVKDVTSESNHLTSSNTGPPVSPPLSPNATLNLSLLSINNESIEEDDPVINDTNEFPSDLDVLVSNASSSGWKRSDRYEVYAFKLQCLYIKKPRFFINFVNKMPHNVYNLSKTFTWKHFLL